MRLGVGSIYGTDTPGTRKRAVWQRLLGTNIGRCHQLPSHCDYNRQ